MSNQRQTGNRAMSGKKSTKNGSGAEQEVFVFDGVFLHYTCGCHKNAEMTLNKQNPVVDIDIPNTCRKHRGSTVEELVIGTKSIRNIQCPCCRGNGAAHGRERRGNIGSYVAKVPIDDFISYVGQSPGMSTGIQTV